MTEASATITVGSPLIEGGDRRRKADPATTTAGAGIEAIEQLIGRRGAGHSLERSDEELLE